VIYLEQGIVVTDSALLRRHYTRTRTFRVDVMSVLPTDALYAWLGTAATVTSTLIHIAVYRHINPGSHLNPDCSYTWLGTAATYVRLNRLLRVGRLAEFLERVESRTNYPNALRVGILGVVVVLAIHWNACVYYQLSSWIKPLERLRLLPAELLNQTTGTPASTTS